MFTLFRKVNEVVCYIGQCCSGLISQAVRTLNNSAFVLLLEVHLCDPFRCYLIHLRDVDSQISSSDLILIVNWICMHEWFCMHQGSYGVWKSMEKYGIWFKDFPGLEKYGKWKQSMEKYLCFQTCSLIYFFNNRKLRI